MAYMSNYGSDYGQSSANRFVPRGKRRNPEEEQEPQNLQSFLVQRGEQQGQLNRQKQNFDPRQNTQPASGIPNNEQPQRGASQFDSAVSVNGSQQGSNLPGWTSGQAYDPYSGNANASRYAPRIVDRNGQLSLSEHGNYRALTANDLDPNNPENTYNYVSNLYNQTNGTGFQPGVGPQSNNEYRAPNASNAAGLRSSATEGRFAGFNFDREQNPNNSAKDTFAAAGQQATWMPRTKTEAEQWFNEFIAPEFARYGYTVHQVQGDKVLVSTRENPQGEWVDFLQGADGDNPMLAWQSEMSGEGNAPLGDAILGGSALGGATSGTDYTSLLGELGLETDDPRWRAFLESIGVNL